jgi:hypothetical protein
MKRAFFSYASEDRRAVEAVYEHFLARAPGASAWLDKYEILAGENLIDRIANGMDDSDKFVIFLSAISVVKPWVNAELRRAIMREIDGIDPYFIIPVLVGDISTVPAFLEHKKYIPLYKMTEDEWFPELDAAISGINPTPALELTDNVATHWEVDPGHPNVVRIIFKALFWATKIAFGVETSEDIVDCRVVPQKPRMTVWQNIETIREARVFAQRAESPELRVSDPFVFVLTFAPGVDALAAITNVTHWVDP